MDLVLVQVRALRTEASGYLQAGPSLPRLPPVGAWCWAAGSAQPAVREPQAWSPRGGLLLWQADPQSGSPLSRRLPLTPPSWRRQWSWLSPAMNLFCAFLFPRKQTCPLLPRAARDQVALHDFPQTSPEAPFSINLEPELQGPENTFLRTKCKELIV